MKNEYLEHINFLSKLPDDSVSNEVFIYAFKRLLKLLPNKGKLYKYKLGTEPSFDRTYKSLKNSYIWMSKVTNFNDRFDCTINYDYESVIEKLSNFLDDNKITVLRFYLFKEHETPETRYFTFNDEQNKYLLLSTKYLDNDGNIDKFGLSFELKNRFNNYSESLLNNFVLLTEKAYKDLLKEYENFKKELIESLQFVNSDRESINVFCLCERYDLNSMWAHYCNNSGLVIEYDFSKLLNQDISLIKKCISIYKVNYRNKQKLDLASLFESFYKEEDFSLEQNNTMINQLTTKDKSWSFEKEWRLILINVEEKFPIDIVSGLYIDYELFEKKKCRKLLLLARERGWNVFIRKQNQLKNNYEYIKYVFNK